MERKKYLSQETAKIIGNVIQVNGYRKAVLGATTLISINLAARGTGGLSAKINFDKF